MTNSLFLRPAHFRSDTKKVSYDVFEDIIDSPKAVIETPAEAEVGTYSDTLLAF